MRFQCGPVEKPIQAIASLARADQNRRRTRRGITVAARDVGKRPGSRSSRSPYFPIVFQRPQGGRHPDLTAGFPSAG